MTTDHNVIHNKGESWFFSDRWCQVKWEVVAFDRSTAKWKSQWGSNPPHVRICEKVEAGEETYLFTQKPSLTVTKGKILSIPAGIDEEVSYTGHTDPGDCGCGVWNSNGALIGIHRADLGQSNGFLRITKEMFNPQPRLPQSVDQILGPAMVRVESADDVPWVPRQWGDLNSRGLGHSK